VRWLREPKRWYEPNASTFLEAMDSGQATSPQSAGLVQLCFGFVARKLRTTGAGWRERSIRMTLLLAFLTPDFLVADAVAPRRHRCSSETSIFNALAWMQSARRAENPQ
jgi:hypothetical protein